MNAKLSALYPRIILGILKPEIVFLVSACSFGFAVLVANGPFQAPDENDHFARVFQLSEGTLIGERRGNASGGELPKAAISVTNTEGIPFHYKKKMTYALFERLSHPRFLDWNKAPRAYYNFPHTVVYPPAGYIPQALAVFFGRLFRIGPLGLMYLARLAGFSASVVLCYAALRLLPIYRWTTVVLLLCPMSLYLFGSIASDGMLIAGATLLMARLTLIEVRRDRSVGLCDLTTTLVIAGLLALAKPVYLPFTAIALYVVIPRLGSLRSRVLFGLAAGVCCVLPVMAWLRIAAALFVPADGDVPVDPTAQLHFVFETPVEFLGLVVRTVQLQYIDNFHWMVGTLGWGDTPMPSWFYPTFGYGILACLVLESSGAKEIKWRLRVVMVIAAVVSVILIYTAQYSTWNAPGSVNPIAGIEGRYFLPLLPLLALSFPPILPRSFPGLAAASASILSILGACICLWAVIARYYGPSIPLENTARLTSFSTRALVGTKENILITGFVVSGQGLETLLIRADGPSLTKLGISGVLARPSLNVLDSSGATLASNVGWGTNHNPADIANSSAAVGASILPADSADSALILRAPEGKYTIEVTGEDGAAGIAQENIYELSHSGTRITNISSRTYVGKGRNMMIIGFVVAGKGADELLARADGPSLRNFGVIGALEKPILELSPLHFGVLMNTAWGNSPDRERISAASSLVGTFPLAARSADCAAIVSFSPGAYCMKVYGVGESAGVALAELYEVP